MEVSELGAFRAAFAQLSSAEQVAVEREAIEALLNPAYYLDRYADVRDTGLDPVEHFRTVGWRQVRWPTIDFDTGWYWSMYLDPARDDVNPLVHWALVGQPSGFPTHALAADPLPASALPEGARRAVLFAGYDRDGIVDDTVVAYIGELARFADVFYLADCEMRPGELGKLAGITQGAWALRHGAYDFGSYARLASDLVGWDRLDEYDEMLLVNDSGFLLRPLDDVFATMSPRSCDWWGLQVTEEPASLAFEGGQRLNARVGHDILFPTRTEPIPAAAVPGVVRDMFEKLPYHEFHIGSYFVALRRPAFQDPAVRRLLGSMHPTDKQNAILRYEFGLTKLLVSRGHAWSTYIGPLYPFHPLYSDWAYELLEQGFPLLKRLLVADNLYGAHIADWQDRVRSLVPGAPIEAIEAYLRRTVSADHLEQSRRRYVRDDGTFAYEA